MASTSLYGSEFGKTSNEYVLGQAIGAGGYGDVYLATDIELGRKVAIKVLKKTDTGRYPEKVRQRFLREARIIAQLREPTTVQLYEFGTDEKTKYLYMVFEFIEGRSLGQVIEQDGPMEPGRVVEILKQVLGSLEEAHTRGVLHRDIKPGNIMLFDGGASEELRRRDQVKVLDFGIGKLMSDVSTQLTADGSTLGTPKYMSPEQLAANELRPSSDIFSLGLVAYELLVGEAALGNDIVEVALKLKNDERILLPEHVCKDAPGVRLIVEKMLEKRWGKRYDKAKDVVIDLMHLRTLDSVERESGLLPAGHAEMRLPSQSEEKSGVGTPSHVPEHSEEALGRSDEVPNVEHSTIPSDRSISRGFVLSVALAAVVALAGVTYLVWPETPENGIGTVEVAGSGASNEADSWLDASSGALATVELAKEATRAARSSAKAKQNVSASMDVVSGAAFAALETSRLEADGRARELLEQELRMRKQNARRERTRNEATQPSLTAEKPADEPDVGQPSGSGAMKSKSKETQNDAESLKEAKEPRKRPELKTWTVE